MFNLALLLTDQHRPLDAVPYLESLLSYYPSHVKVISPVLLTILPMSREYFVSHTILPMSRQYLHSLILSLPCKDNNFSPSYCSSHVKIIPTVPPLISSFQWVIPSVPHAVLPMLRSYL